MAYHYFIFKDTGRTVISVLIKWYSKRKYNFAIKLKHFTIYVICMSLVNRHKFVGSLPKKRMRQHEEMERFIKRCICGIFTHSVQICESVYTIQSFYT